MCLILTLRAPAAARQHLEKAAQSLDSTALQLHIEHLPRWSWAGSEDVRATISESGGCACSLLADEAEWDAECWAMRPEILGPLASTLAAVINTGLSQFCLEALWTGDEAEHVEHVSTADLLSSIRAGEVGVRAQYLVQAPA